MATQQLFYEAPVPVTAQRHGDLSVKAGDGYGFAARVNSVPLSAVEFAEAAAEYPVVFAGSEKAVFPAAILGLRDNENLCVDAEGRWTGRYIPAFIRRYPYIFAQDEGGQTLTLTIDEAFAGCNREGRGERLFDAEGAQTQYLRGVLAFLQDYQARLLRTQAFCARIVELGLLQPMQAQYADAAGATRTLSGFLAVDRAKLKALPAETLAAMMAQDELECLFLHLGSLRHFGEMARRLPRAAAGAEPALTS